MGEFPNKATQFKPGHIPVCGRPKGSLNVKTLINLVWNQKYTIEELKAMGIVVNSGTINKIAGEIATRKIMEQAMSGDVKSFETLLDRVDGKPKQVTEEHVYDHGPLIVDDKADEENEKIDDTDTNGNDKEDNSSQVSS